MLAFRQQTIEGNGNVLHLFFLNLGIKRMCVIFEPVDIKTE